MHDKKLRGVAMEKYKELRNGGLSRPDSLRRLSEALDIPYHTLRSWYYRYGWEEKVDKPIIEERKKMLKHLGDRSVKGLKTLTVLSYVILSVGYSKLNVDKIRSFQDFHHLLKAFESLVRAYAHSDDSRLREHFGKANLGEYIEVHLQQLGEIIKEVFARADLMDMAPGTPAQIHSAAREFENLIRGFSEGGWFKSPTPIEEDIARGYLEVIREEMMAEREAGSEMDEKERMLLEIMWWGKSPREIEDEEAFDKLIDERVMDLEENPLPLGEDEGGKILNAQILYNLISAKRNKTAKDHLKLSKLAHTMAEADKNFDIKEWDIEKWDTKRKVWLYKFLRHRREYLKTEGTPTSKTL